MENIEKAVNITQNVINEEHWNAAGTESVTDEGVFVTFENVKEGTDEGLRKRKESIKHPATKEESIKEKEIKDTTEEVQGRVFGF